MGLPLKPTTPLVEGYRPVNKEKRAGMHEGQVVYALRNSIPSRANLSSVGVRTTGCLLAERQSPRIWSGMMSRISGRTAPESAADEVLIADSTTSRRKGAFMSRLCHKLELLAMRNQPGLKRAPQKPADGFPALLAVIERPMIHVHPDKFVREIPPHVARILEGVLHRGGAMIEAELNARRQNVRDALSRRRVEPFVDHVAAKRQRQAIRLSSPPGAQVLAHLQSLVLKCELSFVNDQTCIGPVLSYGTKNLVKGNNEVINFCRPFLEPQLQSQEGAGHRAWYSDFFPRDFRFRKYLFRHHHWPVSISHARAARQKRVLVTHIGIGMDADGGDVQFPARGAFVEGLDVLQHVLECE